MAQTADDILASTELHTDDKLYRLLALPADGLALAGAFMAEAGAAFSALIIDKDELSLLISDEQWRRHQSRLPYAKLSEQTYRLITFSAALAPDLVGFIARVSQTLAAAGIPILALAAFSRDHILVPAADFPRAIAELQGLQSKIRRGR